MNSLSRCECDIRNEMSADLVALHERTKKFCQRAGERHLVVLAEAAEQFRKALHSLGYGMPRV